MRQGGDRGKDPNTTDLAVKWVASPHQPERGGANRDANVTTHLADAVSRVRPSRTPPAESLGAP